MNNPQAQKGSDVNDWKINCSNLTCQKEIIYTNKSAFDQALVRIRKGSSIQCRSCAAKGFTCSDETKEKLRNRPITEEQRDKWRQGTKNRYKNMTAEQKAEHVAKQREG